MQLSMYMRLTTNATTQKALPAHSLITFTTFGYKIKIFPPPTLPHLKKIKEKERRSQIKCLTLWAVNECSCNTKQRAARVMDRNFF